MRKWTLLGVLLLLTACSGGSGGGGSGAGGGGGGGSSGGGTSGGFRVQLTQSSVSFDLVQGATPTSQTVRATWTGTPPDPLFVGALLQGSGLSQTIPLQLTSSDAAATLTPSAGLAAGQYSGVVQFLVCTDSACTQRVGGSPLNISYTVTVRAPVFDGPPTIALSHTRWTPASPGVTLAVNAAAGSWTATASSPIALSQSSGNGAANVVVSVDGARVTGAGIVNGTVTFTSATGTQSSAVTVTVAQPNISIGSLGIRGVNGAPLTPAVAAVNVSLNPSAPVAVNFTASSSDPWLSVSSAASTATNVTPGSLQVTANPSVGPLASGQHGGNVRVRIGTPTDFTNIDVPVSLELTRASFAFAPSPVVLGGRTGRDFVPASFGVSLNTGPNAYLWSATPTTSWMALSPSSGAAGAGGQSLSLTPNRLASVPGTATGNVNFTAQVNGDVITQSLPVSFNLDNHRLIASEIGVPLVDLPGTAWDRLTKTVSIVDNFGLATPWTAASDQGWLQVTPGGTGSGALVLTANTAGLGTDQYYEATVTVTSSDNTIASNEQIRIGLWVGSSVPSAGMMIGNTSGSPLVVVGDPIRPLFYVLEWGVSQVRVINPYTAQELAPIPGLPALSGITSSFATQNGGTLFVWNQVPGTGYQYVPVNLRARTVGSPIASNKFGTGRVDHFKHLRPGGVDMLFNSDGEIQRLSGGASLGFGFVGYGGASGNSLRLFNGGTFNIDFTAAGGGTFIRDPAPGIGSFGVDNHQESNFDGSRVFAISNVSSSDLTANKLLVGNGITGGASGTASSGLWYQDMMMTLQGRLVVISRSQADPSSVASLHVFDTDNVERFTPAAVGPMGDKYQGTVAVIGTGHFAGTAGSDRTVRIVPIGP